jgi:hypothetical protein
MVAFVRKRAVRRGPLGGSREWTIVWAVLLSARLLRRLTKAKPEVVFSQAIKPGESLLIAGDGGEPRVIGGPERPR